MNDKKELYKTMSVSAFLNIFGKDEDKMQRMFVGVASFAGAEVTTVSLRKNFKDDSINQFAFGTSVACFLIIAAFSFYYGFQDNEQDLYLRGIIYLVITGLVLWQGLKKIPKSKGKYPLVESEPELFYFLKKEKIPDNIIQYVIEPAFLISIGGFYCFYDFWGGFPILFCGASIWMKWVIGYFILGNKIQNDINDNDPLSSNPNSKRRYTAK